MRRRAAVGLVAALVLGAGPVVQAPAAAATTAGVDPLFSGGRPVVVPFERWTVPNDAVRRPAGAVDVVGTTWRGDKNYDGYLASVGRDGGLQRPPTIVDLGADDTFLAAETDFRGRTVVVGRTLLRSGVERPVVLRFTSNGAPDPSFGSNGRVVEGGLNGRFADVAVVGDQITVAGSVLGPDGRTTVALGRYRDDGTRQLDFLHGATLVAGGPPASLPSRTGGSSPTCRRRALRWPGSTNGA